VRNVTYALMFDHLHRMQLMKVNRQNITQAMSLWINASDDKGVEVVRDHIQDFVSAKTIFNDGSVGFKMVILDECDAMTPEAQFAIRSGK